MTKMVRPKLVPNEHYWLKTPLGEWIIGQYTQKIENTALDPDIDGFIIIGSTVVIAPNWFTTIKGPIIRDDSSTVRQ